MNTNVHYQISMILTMTISLTDVKSKYIITVMGTLSWKVFKI